MKLIICEKSSVGNAYAQALGVTSKKDGYFENNEYLITWAVGHLVELANAEIYDERYKKWSLADLPIIPQEWKYVVSEGKNKQFGVIKNLMNRAEVSEVINACDAGREGQLIFDLIYRKAGCKLPIKRAWLSSMETKAIVEAFNNLRDGAEFENLCKSALCRAKSDWLLGVNSSRCYTKLYNKK